MTDIFDVIGVKAGVIIAGFGGALARIAFFGTGGSGVLSSILSVIGGTVTAIYLGPVAPAYFGWKETGQATAAFTFLVGVFGMEICKQVGLQISKWTPTAKGGANGKQ